MSNKNLVDGDLVASYQDAMNLTMEKSGALQEIPSDLLREVAGALQENPR